MLPSPELAALGPPFLLQFIGSVDWGREQTIGVAPSSSSSSFSLKPVKARSYSSSLSASSSPASNSSSQPAFSAVYCQLGGKRVSDLGQWSSTRTGTFASRSFCAARSLPWPARIPACVHQNGICKAIFFNTCSDLRTCASVCVRDCSSRALASPPQNFDGAGSIVWPFSGPYPYFHFSPLARKQERRGGGFKGLDFDRPTVYLWSQECIPP